MTDKNPPPILKSANLAYDVLREEISYIMRVTKTRLSKTNPGITSPCNGLAFVPPQPPPPGLRHGRILGYYLGFREEDSSQPFRYQSVQSSSTQVSGFYESKVMK